MPSVNVMDDLVVVCASMNPKKAKKQQKKANRKAAEAASAVVVEDVVSTPVKAIENKVVNRAPKQAIAEVTMPKSWQMPAKKSWADIEDLSTNAGSDCGSDDTPSLDSLHDFLVPSSGPKKSWFELTEEDDDDFIPRIH